MRSVGNESTVKRSISTSASSCSLSVSTSRACSSGARDSAASAIHRPTRTPPTMPMNQRTSFMLRVVTAQELQLLRRPGSEATLLYANGNRFPASLMEPRYRKDAACEVSEHDRQPDRRGLERAGCLQV